MAYELNLRQLFSPKAVAEAIERLPKLETPVMDSIYKDRRSWPFPMIGRSEIAKTIGNQPVGRRGSTIGSFTRFRSEAAHPIVHYP